MKNQVKEINKLKANKPKPVSSSSYIPKSISEPSSIEETIIKPIPSFENASIIKKPNNAMKLQTNKSIIMPDFIEQKQQKEQVSKVVVTETEKYHLKLDEKISLTCGKDGGIQNLEVLGVLTIKIISQNEDDAKLRISVLNKNKALQLQTNPNIDKVLFKQNSIVGLKDATKSFPLNTDCGILKWRFQSLDESDIPLTLNCWPSETKNGFDVCIEYELQKLNLELDSVNIQVPISRTIGVAPLVKHIDGDYKFDKLKNILIWQIANIDKLNSNGSIEFSVSGAGHVNDFFPINVNFSSQKSYCDLQIAQVCHISDLSQAVKHSLETNFTVDQYNII
jgi:coatomer subunit delta